MSPVLADVITRPRSLAQRARKSTLQRVGAVVERAYTINGSNATHADPETSPSAVAALASAAGA